MFKNNINQWIFLHFGPISIQVYGNGQDGIGNTMNDGKIIVHGNAGDLLAMSMRGGKIFIRGMSDIDVYYI